MSSFVVSVIVVVAVIAGCTWLAPAPGAAAGHQRATRVRQRVSGPRAGGDPDHARARSAVSLLGLLAVVGTLVAAAVGLALVALDALLKRAAGA